MEEQARLETEALESARAYLLTFSPGDLESMDRVDQTIRTLQRTLEEATYYIEGSQ